MRLVFKCEPPPTKGLILAAYQDRNIVGSIVLRNSDSDQNFSLEARYELNDDNPLAQNRQCTIEGSRWIATVPSVSGLLLKAAAQVSLEFGREYMLIEAKPYSVMRLQELGWNVSKVEGATISLSRTLEMVGAEGMKYFEEPPEPTLYLIHLRSLL